jgi:hypothetical protein|tara:strand:- start:13176 stop:14498 length:1323 start_codon:yes stop_codon:yes gene_type:complete
MIQDKKLQEKLKWHPHEGQKEVLGADGREVMVVAGRRWGKSAVSGYIIVKTFLEKLLEIKKGEADSVKIWIVAPTYELSNKVFEYVVKFLLAYDKRFGQFVQNRPQPGITISESIWIQCKSTTEPMGLLGEELDLQVVDEAALIPEQVYHQYLKPTTLSRKGKVVYIGTPRGKGWFESKFYFLKEKGQSFTFKSTDGVSIAPEELEEVRKTTPKLLFQQEYEAQFVSEAGIVFRNVEEVTVPSAEVLTDAQPGRKYIMGVDLAEVQDYTAITIVDAENHRVVHFDRFQGKDYPLQKEHITLKARRYNNARIILDTTGVGKPIYEDLRKSGLFAEDYTFSGKSKEELIGKLIVFLEEKYVTIPDIQVLQDELRAFEYKYINEKTGERLKTIQYGAPSGYHDDTVISLALAVWGLYSGKPKFQDHIAKELAKVKRKKTISYV